jgi:hypothetical protein
VLILSDGAAPLTRSGRLMTRHAQTIPDKTYQHPR